METEKLCGVHDRVPGGAGEPGVCDTSRILHCDKE